MDISNDLSWKAHISRITGNANQSLGFLRRNLKATNPALREKAYKAIVRPPPPPSWSMLLQSGTLPIQVCQTCWRSLAGELSSSGALMYDWSYFIRLYMAMSLSLSLVMLFPLHVSQELHIHWLFRQISINTPFTPLTLFRGIIFQLQLLP